MMGLFYLLTLYSVIRYSVIARSPGGATKQPQNRGDLEIASSSLGTLPRNDGAFKWQILAILSSTLGMATKEVMATAPFIILLYDRIFLVSSWREIRRKRLALYAGLFATWAVLAAILIGQGAARISESAGF